MYRYKLLLLKPCTKALSQSTKISLRMDHRGFLSLQCMILTEDKQVCFVEFLVSGKWNIQCVNKYNCNFMQCVPDEETADEWLLYLQVVMREYIGQW